MPRNDSLFYFFNEKLPLGIRVKDLNSEAARNYGGPVFFPLDMSYRVSATFVPSDGKKSVDVPNVLGDVTPTPMTGKVHFKLNGQELTLTALDRKSTRLNSLH